MILVTNHEEVIKHCESEIEVRIACAKIFHNAYIQKKKPIDSQRIKECIFICVRIWEGKVQHSIMFL